MIYRRNVSGDETSRVFEKDVPEALGDESQRMVGILYKCEYECAINSFDFLVAA